MRTRRQRRRSPSAAVPRAGSADHHRSIDLDPTDDPTHGAQQLTFFNGHYDCWCYLPLLAFLTFDDEDEQSAARVLSPPSRPRLREFSGDGLLPGRLTYIVPRGCARVPVIVSSGDQYEGTPARRRCEGPRPFDSEDVSDGRPRLQDPA
ncbi:MAG: transposase [Acidobacteria bacterium]|nr:transposase [Acidobacteriota bacterium]